jgi:hypothetical protein
MRWYRTVALRSVERDGKTVALAARDFGVADWLDFVLGIVILRAFCAET